MAEMSPAGVFELPQLSRINYRVDDLQQEVTAFKNKWFKTSRKEQAKAVINLSLDILRGDLYACFCPESTSHE